ncbi:MAG: cobalamin biosynthesis protein CbiD [Clostridia bacterium]|nr:cobalamin biosynthesis protein CbiD [Clostridia bacterium]
MSGLRTGFTTGACAAACALASCLWQRDGECPERAEIVLPAGERYAPEIRALSPFRCAVIKDAGDDPDVTDGCEVWAEAEIREEDGEITFEAGEGVGVITLPGLKLPPGEAAINPAPRRMIADAVRSVTGGRAVRITVGITGGRELALRTFNPRLGVEGGLSVLGTTGIVRPMSEEALKESIRLELSVKRAQGAEDLALVFGSQGEAAFTGLGFGWPCVQMSNYVGFALDEAAGLGFRRILLCGQPGKLVKVAGGSMQTHSAVSDGRRETLCAHLALLGAPRPLLEGVMEGVTLEGAVRPIASAGYARVWEALCGAAAGYAAARARGAAKTGAVMQSASGAVLGMSKEAKEWLLDSAAEGEGRDG